MLPVDQLHDQISEAAVIGSMLIDARCIPGVLGIVGLDDFYGENNRVLYTAILETWKDAKDFDPVLVRSWLSTRGLMKQAGGLDYMRRAIDTVPTSANARYYARQVKEKSRYREAVQAVEKMTKVINESQPVKDQIEAIQNIALGLRGEDRQNVYPTEAYASQAALSLRNRSAVHPTDFHGLDTILGGLEAGDFCIVAGRPAMGKSAFAMQMGLNFAMRGNTVIVFSLEMTATAMMQRLCSLISEVPLERMRQADPDNESLEVFYQASLDLEKLDIVIVEGVDTVEQQHAFIRGQKQVLDVGLVVIDYLQLMVGGKQSSRYEQVTEISRNLKKMALSEKVPVLGLSQLSRKCEERPNKRPRLSDLRESGGIEQDADQVLLLYRDDYYRKLEKPDIDSNDLDGICEIAVAKHRRGPQGISKMLFVEEITKFKSLHVSYLRG
jgi:replicative DNA helicase